METETLVCLAIPNHTITGFTTFLLWAGDMEIQQWDWTALLQILVKKFISQGGF
jgi:hypothetical protein